jgi:DNA-binding MarR family transcriptional regulator
LVERRSNDRDLRETVAHSTPAGRALAARLIERALEHERTWLRDSSPAEVALFKRMLHAIIERGHAPHPLLAA